MATIDDISSLAAWDSSDDEVAASEEKQVVVGHGTTIHGAGFKDFLLKPELLRAIADCGFEHPSEVQNEAIPQAVLGNDLICQAKAGMGKTAIFVLATLQQLEVSDNVLCMVLCHTRELAYQISFEFERFCKHLPEVRRAVIYGGVDARPQKALFDKPETTPHIIIGTPGRVLQLVSDKTINLGKLKHFILDECDQCLGTLDMRRDVQRIFRFTPHEKQVLMFTATLSEEIRGVCKKFMNDPIEIIVQDGAKLTLHGLKQYYVQLEEKAKTRKLVDLLDKLEFNQCIVFVSSVRRADELNKLLFDSNFPSIAIYGSLKQEERIERYRKFKDFRARIMVATDIFGRGIDIERVNVVINYDMPKSAESYLHRVGRAGRFGTKGLAISFVASSEDGQVLNDVQGRFVVDVPTLPEEVDPATYMQN